MSGLTQRDLDCLIESMSGRMLAVARHRRDEPRALPPAVWEDVLCELASIRHRLRVEFDAQLSAAGGVMDTASRWVGPLLPSAFDVFDLNGDKEGRE